MPGIPVVITDKYGIPVRQVTSGAPLMTVAVNGMGIPVVLSDRGAPFVVEGAGPPPEVPLLDQVAGAYTAWSFGRVLKTGSTPITGTSSAITALNDQIGSNNATPVNFTALATDQVNSKNYGIWDGNQYLTLAAPLVLSGDFTISLGIGFTATTGSRAILGREGVSNPYLRMTRLSAIFNGTVLTGSWDIGLGFHQVYIQRQISDGATTIYVDGEVWATGTFAGSFTNVDRIGRNQTGNYFSGGIGEIIIWNTLLSGGDRDIVQSNVESAWRSQIFIGGASGNNANAGWSAARALANFDLYNVASGYLPLRPGSRLALKYGAAFGRSPLYIIQSNQAGSAAKPNSIGMYGDPADGIAVLDFTNDLSGATWTLVTGTKYSTPVAYPGAVIHWRKPGYSPMALANACQTAYDTAKAAGSGNVDFSAANALIQKVTPAASAAAVGLNQFFADGTTLTMDIGQDPTGLNIRFSATNGITLSSGRTMQIARNYWNTSLWLALEGATEDGLAYSGSNCNIAGESLARPLVVIGSAGDTMGGKGGSSNTGTYLVGILAGIGTQLTGSNGDAYSWHGASGVSLVDCRGWMAGKSGFDHEQGTTVSHTRCITAGCYQPWQVLNQGGGTGAWSYTDCEAILQSTEPQAMFQLLSTLGGTATFSGGYYRGNASATINKFIRGGTGNTMNATGQANRTGFTPPDITNAGSGSMVVAN